MAPVAATRIAVATALRTIRRSPVRSLLILQGVIWATVIGILPPAIIRGSREAALERARELGSDRMLIYDAATPPSLGWNTVSRVRSFRDGDVRRATGYAHAPPLLLVDASSPEDADRRLVAGRWFSEEELAGKSPVCLIGAAAARERFGERGPLGETVSLTDPARDLRVIGVFEIAGAPSRDLDRFGYRKDHPLHGLVEGILYRMGVIERDFEWLGDESLLVAPPGAIPDRPPDLIVARADPRRLFDITRDLRRELVREGMQPLIIANPVVQILFSGPMETIDRLHGVIFTICLLVGTVVVANTMVLSILERQKEIALRRVEGATTVAVALQIIAETGVFCLAGALLAIPVAFALAWLRCSLDPSGSIVWTVPFPELARTMMAVVLFGLAGGILPALRAARTEPARVLAHD